MEKIEDPVIVESLPDDGSVPSYDEFDRTVLEECGYDVNSDAGKAILENVVAESMDDKIFTIRDGNNSDKELKQSFKIDDTVYEILKNEEFDNYWRNTILKNLDTERDKLLLEQIGDSFIGDCVYRKLNELGKLEVFYYIDFFREILSKSENDETLSIVEFDDEVFGKMPNVMRLY